MNILKVVVLIAVAGLPVVAKTDVPFGQNIVSGNVTVFVAAVRWSALAARGIPVVAGQPDVVQVLVLAASPSTTSFTVEVNCTVDGAPVVATVLAQRATDDPTMIQLPVGTIKSTITVQSVHIVEHLDG